MTDSNSGTSAENRPYLGDPQIIEKFLKNIVRETIQCRVASKQGILSPEDAKAIEEKEATNAARALLGRDKKYAVDANWNVPGVIDSFVKDELKLAEKGAEPIVVAGLMHFVREVQKRLNLLEDPKQSATAENEIQDILEKYRNVLLGLSAVVPATEPEPVSVDPMFEEPVAVSEASIPQTPVAPPPPVPIHATAKPESMPQVQSPAVDVVTPMPTPTPTQQEPARSGGGLKWAALLILLLVIGGVTFFIVKKPTPAPAPVTVVEKPVIKTPPPARTIDIAPVLNGDGTIDLIDDSGKTVKTISMKDGKLIIQIHDFARNGSKTSFLVATESADETYNLWIIDESGEERLVHSTVYDGKLSSDASHLAYTTANHTLIVEDAAGKKIASADDARDFTWATDKNSIVFIQHSHADSFRLSQLTLEDQSVSIIAAGLYDNAMPIMQPNGKEIFVVAGTATGLPSFWKIATTGGAPRQVTNVRLDETNAPWIPTPFNTAQWSTDGRWLIYDFKDGLLEQIWGLEFDDAGNVKRSARLADGLLPRWITTEKFVCLKMVNGSIEAIIETVPES